MCFICEIFLFHLHSKAFSSTLSHAAMRDLSLDVKLPQSFFVKREDGNTSSYEAEQHQLNREVAEHFAGVDQSISTANQHELNSDVDGQNNTGKNSLTEEYTVKSVSQQGTSKIEIKSKKRKSNQKEESNSKNESLVDEDEEIKDIKVTCSFIIYFVCPTTQAFTEVKINLIYFFALGFQK